LPPQQQQAVLYALTQEGKGLSDSTLWTMIVFSVFLCMIFAIPATVLSALSWRAAAEAAAAAPPSGEDRGPRRLEGNVCKTICGTLVAHGYGQCMYKCNALQEKTPLELCVAACGPTVVTPRYSACLLGCGSQKAPFNNTKS
jgi:hypothetical protein